jgi:hypothetical protein
MLKSFQGMVREENIIQCLEGKEDINKSTDERGRCMTRSMFPLHVHKYYIFLSTPENQELHSNRFEYPIGDWLESVLLETPVAYQILNALQLDCKYTLCIQVESHLFELFYLSFIQ